MDDKDFGLFIGLFYAVIIIICGALGVWLALQI